MSQNANVPPEVRYARTVADLRDQLAAARAAGDSRRVRAICCLLDDLYVARAAVRAVDVELAKLRSAA